MSLFAPHSPLASCTSIRAQREMSGAPAKFPPLRAQERNLNDGGDPGGAAVRGCGCRREIQPRSLPLPLLCAALRGTSSEPRRAERVDRERVTGMPNSAGTCRAAGHSRKSAAASAPANASQMWPRTHAPRKNVTRSSRMTRTGKLEARVACLIPQKTQKTRSLRGLESS